ncbi:PLP-dependent transferase [Dendrothele bispora CBS 962.96]|uniref:PLP-dependent transferase n=1 Tax=Dendrothele bispora (strain CBS 962.96) TaxID=1314807 RepID=A0A4S8LNM8_DENBC|nr:PLP-dependent transferase [Dendrothele bispora CBS 962.96]
MPSTDLPLESQHPKAVDLSHHVNKVSSSIRGSPLKHIFQYLREPGMVSLAGGLPHPNLFPYQQLDLKVYAPDAKIIPGETVTSSMNLSIPQYASETHQLNTLSRALQYYPGRSSPTLTALFYDFTARIMRPGYADWQILLNSGSTDGWSKVVNLLCEPGDYIIVEEHTFPSAHSLWAPMGCKGVPVKMDKDGMIPEDLERIMDGWEQNHPEVKKPHLLYTVPVGQNPTGSTLTFERKKAIYETCVKHDIIICEDDPYYFLQLPRYVSPSERNGINDTPQGAVSDADLLKILVPPFVHIDYQGRVIRLETLSKTLGPGNRLGYFVCNAAFAERLVHATEVISQAPSGWSQAIIEELLVTWRPEGYIRWLLGVRENYGIRRDWICDIIRDVFDVLPAGNEYNDDFIAVKKGHGQLQDTKSAPFFSFTYPKGGMFLYIKLYLSQNPKFRALRNAAENQDEEANEKWTREFWKDLIQEKILLTPHFFYTPPGNVEKKEESDVAFFRMTFSYETREDMHIGIQRLAKAFEKNWEMEN